jgi:predicted dinucleotide-binding enzyme
MKLGIIGAGNVGGTLGARWAQAGHTVTFSAKDPGSAKMADVLAKAGPNARAGLIEQAVEASDLVLLATPWAASEEVVRGIRGWEGKILIDATNPLLPDLSGLAIGTTTSAAEMISQWAPQAKVVKAFNTVGFNIMANPDFGGSKVAMFYCGDDHEAKQKVHQLATELGFDALDAGPLKQARQLEPFALLWISLAYMAGYGREIGFQFMRR